jgi:hypothetical protein
LPFPKEDPTISCGKTYSGQFTDSDRAQNLYTHLVGYPDRWNSLIVTREANTATHPHKGPSKRSMGVPLQIAPTVCEFVSMEALPVTLLLRAHVASGDDLMHFAELHVFHQCRYVSEHSELLLGLGMALNSAMRAMRPGSNPGLPRATSRLFARAPGRVAYWVSGGFPLTNCMCIPACGARPKL